MNDSEILLLSPAPVFKYFEEMAKIPHGSGNTKKISDYLVDFAVAHGLKYIQDDSNNVVIFKDGSVGYENSAPVIIQGHMDMVCEKEPDCDIDFDNDGLELYIDGAYLKAKGTTLGADDGIAVAMALAVLEDNEIPHPPIEAVFTVDEEIGMLGATAFDASVLRGRTMLNLDTEDEGQLLVSCAGGVTATCGLKTNKVKMTGYETVVTIDGLTGGHSGIEIHRNRANSNQLMGRLLYSLMYDYDIYIADINGGLKDNAIPRKTMARLIVPEDTDLISFDKDVKELLSVYRWEYENTDPDMDILCEVTLAAEEYECLDKESTKKVITALYTLPGGVQKMSQDIEGLVQTSLNMGILKMTDDVVIMSYSVRSSKAAEKVELLTRMECLIKYLGGVVSLDGDYPAWEYKKESPLRDLMIDIFKEQYKREPIVYAVHAGVECGIFADKLPGLDCVSFGPELKDIHTTSERMDIMSVQRTYDYLLEILKRLK